MKMSRIWTGRQSKQKTGVRDKGCMYRKRGSRGKKKIANKQRDREQQ